MDLFKNEFHEFSSSVFRRYNDLCQGKRCIEMRRSLFISFCFHSVFVLEIVLSGIRALIFKLTISKWQFVRYFIRVSMFHDVLQCLTMFHNESMCESHVLMKFCYFQRKSSEWNYSTDFLVVFYWIFSEILSWNIKMKWRLFRTISLRNFF